MNGKCIHKKELENFTAYRDGASRASKDYINIKYIQHLLLIFEQHYVNL